MIVAATFTEWAFEVGFYVSTGGFAFTLWKFLVERREKLAERKRSETLAAEMRDIRRRADGPDLRPLFLHVPKHDSNPNQIVHPGQTLDPARTPAGIQLRLDLANDGASVRHVDDDWPQGDGIGTFPGGIRSGDSVCAFLIYKFEPVKLGVPIKITISFETLSGLKLHQVYETHHGVSDFRRVDPA